MDIFKLELKQPRISWNVEVHRNNDNNNKTIKRKLCLFLGN